MSLTEVSPTARAYFGTLHTKIVGINHYKGYTSPGEPITLDRNPRNMIDRCAIRVLDSRGTQASSPLLVYWLYLEVAAHVFYTCNDSPEVALTNPLLSLFARWVTCPAMPSATWPRS